MRPSHHVTNRAVAVAVVVVALVGCSSSSKTVSSSTSATQTSSPTTAANAPVSSTEAQLVPTTASVTAGVNTKALRLADMPTGFSVNSGNAPETGTANCTDFTKNTPDATDRFSVAFQSGGIGFPTVEEKLANFPPGKAAVDLAKYVSSLDQCKTINTSDNGKAVTATVDQLPFPKFDVDEQRAYHMTVKSAGVTMAIVMVLFRKANVLVDLAYTNLESVNVTDVAAVAPKAVSRLG